METLMQNIQNSSVNEKEQNRVIHDDQQPKTAKTTEKELEIDEKVRDAFESLRRLRGC